MDPLSPNPYAAQNSTPVVLPKQSKKSFFVAVIMTVGFILALAFGMWAFIGMTESKADVDEKIDVASATAVKDTEAKKEAEFAEREKSPYKSFAGSSVYGSLAFSYPKSWSVYRDEGSEGGALFDFYAHPDFVPSSSSQDSIIAFRAQVLSSDYASEVAAYTGSGGDSESDATFNVVAFQASNVAGSEVGVKVSGEIVSGKTGTLVLLPLRDKTLKIWTESDQYTADFDKILATVTFVP